MNPYEILGVKQGATQDEIKSAYRKMVKQYHPDQYGDNPLKDLAQEKMVEINKAYDMLKNQDSGSRSNSGYSSQSSSSNYSGSNDYYEIRNQIQRRNIAAAESMLNNIANRDAEWYFLMGAVMINKGWFDSALTNIERAVQMDPNNFEYRQTLNQLKMRSTSYSQPYRNTASSGACDCCANLICLNCLCNCFGGGC